MPLMVMSPNIQELDSPSRKRSHEEYSESDVPSKPDAAADGVLGLRGPRLENERPVPSEIGRPKLQGRERKNIVTSNLSLSF